VRWLSLLLLAVLGCAAPQQPPQSVSLNRNLRYGIAFWRQEVERVTGDRNAVMVSGHGEYIAGTWHVFPDYGPPMPVETFARALKHVYGDRVLWLLICNSQGQTINVSGVAYPKQTCWAMPDRYCPNPAGPEVGRATEFTLNLGSPFQSTTRPTR
jgi:hypothetical protein